MNTDNNLETSTATEPLKKAGNKKTAFIVSAVSSVVVIALAVVMISTSWTSYGEAKAEVASAENEYSSANSALTIANSYYDDAYAAYASWLSCYLTTSWRYDWMCGSGSSYSSDVDIAEALVSAAEADLDRARTKVKSANSDLDAAAEKFNQSVWIWGTLSVLALAALATFGTIQLRRNKVQRKTEELEARPDWDCPECSTHNEGGMFCIGCGFSKSDLKPGHVVKSEGETVQEPKTDLTAEEVQATKTKAKPKAKSEPKE
jgi:hypothetical protein